MQQVIKISSRLQTIADMIKPCAHLVDVGCDHGYLSIYLVLNKIVNHVLNIDVNKEPLESALKNSIFYNVQHNIDCYLNNGLQNIKLNFQPDYITISGMGGVLISNIIKNSSIFPKKYIVQPNNNISKLRQWFFENNYNILDEKIVFDNEIGYIVIEVEKQDNNVVYNDQDLFIGPIIKQKQLDKNTMLYFKEKLKKLSKIPMEFISETKKRQLNTIKEFLQCQK